MKFSVTLHKYTRRPCDFAARREKLITAVRRLHRQLHLPGVKDARDPRIPLVGLRRKLRTCLRLSCYLKKG